MYSLRVTSWSVASSSSASSVRSGTRTVIWSMRRVRSGVAKAFAGGRQYCETASAGCSLGMVNPLRHHFAELILFV